MKTALFILIFILAIIAFVGGYLTIFESGKKDGICKYTNVGEDEE